MPVFFFASGKVLKMVSTVRMGRSYFWMPWMAGVAPVYMEAKQTGVTDGMTTFVGTRSGATASTFASFSG